jgi:serine/threonine protein kinase
MSPEPSTLSDRDDRLDEIILAYHKAVEAGQGPDPRELVARHADLAVELTAYFAAQRRLDPFVAPFRPEAAAPALAEVRFAGGCELGPEIGRGGMGVIYRGRDSDLDRDLAIKVLREDRQGNPQYEQRFLEEEHILGQLQHPGIVPIHASGRLADGRPFFTMKLVKGQTLAELLRERHEFKPRAESSKPAGFEDSARGLDLPRLLTIFEQVCQTMAYAHSRHVIHRDLKPANIMVGAFGEVQVMDWGLAKVLASRQSAVVSRQSAVGSSSVLPADCLLRLPTDVSPDPVSTETVSEIRPVHGDTPRSSTQTGAAMGTWAYMPPEQARGEVDQLDERSDVFSLGAILCEILTSQPPYTGPTPADVAYQARHGDLTDAYARLARCGADTELGELAQKCLARDRDQRSRDASALAQAVTAYQTGVQERLRRAELERAAAEVKAREERKRRRIRLALQGSMLLLLLALIAGTAFSVYFAIDADQQADQARTKEAEAERNADTAKKNEADAVKAKNKLQSANQELERYSDELEVTLARSLVRPFKVPNFVGTAAPLAEQEIEAMWELAGSRSARLGPRFVKEALRGPLTTRQLRARAVIALHSAVGLDQGKRAQVEKLLVERLQDPKIDDAQRIDVALATVELGDLTPAAAARLIPPIIRLMAKLTDGNVLGPLEPMVAAVSIHLDSKGAAEAAAAFITAMAEATHPETLNALGQGLLTVAPHLDRRDAGRTAAALGQTLGKKTDSLSQRIIAPCLSAVVRRMDLQNAIKTVSDIMAKATEPSALGELVQSLTAPASMVGPQAAGDLIEAIAKTANPNALYALARGLAILAPRIEATDAARAANTLLQRLKDTKHVRDQLVQSLAAVAGRLHAKDAAKVATSLIQSMKDAKTAYDLWPLPYCLSVVASRMDANGAAKVTAQAATILVEVMNPNQPYSQLPGLAKNLSILAVYLNSRDAGQVARSFIQVIRRIKDFSGLFEIGRCMTAVVLRLDAGDAAQVHGLLLQVIKDRGVSNAWWLLSESIRAVATRMESRDAAQVATTLLQAMKDSKDPNKGLSQNAGRPERDPGAGKMDKG